MDIGHCLSSCHFANADRSDTFHSCARMNDDSRRRIQPRPTRPSVLGMRRQDSRLFTTFDTVHNPLPRRPSSIVCLSRRGRVWRPAHEVRSMAQPCHCAGADTSYCSIQSPSTRDAHVQGQASSPRRREKPPLRGSPRAEAQIMRPPPARRTRPAGPHCKVSLGLPSTYTSASGRAGTTRTP